MFRYLRLYVYFVRFSFSRAMEFRIDFFFRIMMDMIYYAINISFYKIIFMHSSNLAGWNEEQAMIFVGGYLFVDALNMTIFANNAWWLPIFINRGDLDYYLIRPVSSLFFLSLRDFAANSFLNLLLAAGILGWAILSYSFPLAPQKVLLYILLLMNGAVLYHIVRMLTVLPVFWMHSGRGTEGIFWHFSRLMERPDAIFRGWARRILLSLLPFGLMASLPSRLLFDGFSVSGVLYLAGTTAVFFLILNVVWRLGLRSYSSASS